MILYTKSKIVGFLLLGTFVSAFAGMRMTLVPVDAKQVVRMKCDQKYLEKVILETEGPEALDIDKAWHGLHFLLSGSPRETKDLAGQIIMGGERIGEDLGYGPAQYHSPEVVKKIHALLNSLAPEALQKRFDIGRMERAGIYPSIWKADGDESLQYLIENYKQLSAFYAKAAKAGKGVLFAVS